MAAVIRMKRHISEEPHSAFILNCKKRKTDGLKQVSTAPGETSTVLKFAGTVNQDTDISEHIAKLSKQEAKDIVNKIKPETGLNKRLEQNREKSQQNRFKIVSYTRALNETSEESSPAPSGNLAIVDVEKDITVSTLTNDVATTSSAQASSFSDISDEPFVYDIYIADQETVVQYPDSIDLNDLSILDYNDYLYSRPRLVNSDSENDDPNEDEDSNDENNWRNDYPDDEMSENESIGERHMRKAMNDFEIGNDLSSDEEDHNGFVYSVDSEAISFEDDLDYCDVNRYGEAYARYKKRAIRELENVSNESGSGSEDEREELSGSEFHSD